MIVVKVDVTIQVTANSTVSIHAVHLYQVGGVDGIGGRAIPKMILAIIILLWLHSKRGRQKMTGVGNSDLL